jgi:steroid delta-isomerase-like uncharacterized protein
MSDLAALKEIVMKLQLKHGARIGPLIVIALSTAAFPADSTNSSAALSRIELNEQLGRRYFEEVWNQGHVDVLDQLLAPTYVNHTPSTPNPPRGPAGLKPIVLGIRRAFPDLHYEIKDVVATDGAVVMRVVMTGTHRGDLFGLAPTGRRVAVNQINIEHIEKGQIVEHWRVTDELTLMRQLGFVQ